jgi:hypothetical protein
MNPAEKLPLTIPSASEYILDNFEHTDRIAVLVLNGEFGETIQRITSAQKAASPEFQAWLRYKNANGSDIYLGMNPLKAGAATRTKEESSVMDLPIVNPRKQRRPALRLDAVNTLVSQSNAQEKALYVLLAATGIRISEARWLWRQSISSTAAERSKSANRLTGTNRASWNISKQMPAPEKLICQLKSQSTCEHL